LPGHKNPMSARLTLAVIVLLIWIAPVFAQSIPPVRSKALDDSEVVLPKPANSQILVLIVGFSHKSGEVCTAWGKHVSADYAKNPRVAYFQVPVLQDAPSFVRPMILHGMREGVPPQELSHFVPVYDKEADWKKLVNFSAPDDAYLILADAQGQVFWQTHGSFNNSAYAELQKSVATLLEKSANSTSPAPLSKP